MTVMINRKLGLPEAFPSSPSRPPRYGLRVTTADGLLNHFSLCEKYALHKMATVLLEGRSTKWTSDNEIVTTDGSPEITLRGDVEVALEYEPKGNEKKWEIPSPYHEQICHLRGIAIVVPDEPAEKERTPRAAPADGLVTLAQLATELKKQPGELRKKLRSSKEEKPSHGWAWAGEDLPRIRKLLS